MARERKENGRGRPSVITPDAIRKLEDAFMLGCSDLEACFAANISKTALYDYQQANPDFSERKAALKERPIKLARKVIVDALEAGDVNSAHKVIERRDGIKQRLEHSGPDGQSMTWNVNVVKAGDKPPAPDDAPAPSDAPDNV